MAELKFSCPHCGQHIQCDGLWGGHQIQCPACHGDLTVPAQLSAPTPMAVPPPIPPARPPMRPPSQPAAPRRPLAPPQTAKTGRPLKVALIAAVALVCAVGGYFGFGFLTELQNKTNEKRREIEKKSDGGEMGHTLALYDVLDRTEPGGPGFGGRRVTGPRQRQNGAARAISIPDQGDASAASAPEKPLPIIPAVYTMDVETAVVPEGQVNGVISGANFVVETARVDADPGGAQVLRLIQGPIASPEREILVYLHPKAGETLVGHTWKISKETRGAAMPSVAKRWKSNPKYAPEIKSFSFGYAMKLELGQMTENGEIPGKLFLALPDKEQSVAAGLFKIRTALYDSDEAAFPHSSKGLTPAEKALLRNR